MSIEYYNKNSQKFFDDTVNIEMTAFYDQFLPLVKDKGKILDVGCGSGRDVKAFNSLGYNSIGIDASKELVAKANSIIQGKIFVMKYLDIAWVNEFDGIWACASLLHEELNNIENVIQKLWKSLRVNSPFYMSFKYGENNYIKNERFFQNYNEKTIKPYLKNLKNKKIHKIWQTFDRRPFRENEKWLNLILIKLN